MLHRNAIWSLNADQPHSRQIFFACCLTLSLFFTDSKLVEAQQEFSEIRLTSPRSVPFKLSSNDLLPNQDRRLYLTAGGAFGPTEDFFSYAPLLDHRRRIVGNSWIIDAELKGPGPADAAGTAVYRLSFDECAENELPVPSLPCTPLAPNAQDRIEFGWRAPGDVTKVIFDDQLNHPNALERESLTLERNENDNGDIYSLTHPGAQFRFVSGPPVPYLPNTRWSDMNVEDRPKGEGTGFVIDEIILRPMPPVAGNPGWQDPQIIEPYEQASGVLLAPGRDANGLEDSFWFTLPPSANPKSVAIHFQSGSGAHSSLPPEKSLGVFARCGDKPAHNAFAMVDFSVVNELDGSLIYSPLFLDLNNVVDGTDGCDGVWHIVIAAGNTLGGQEIEEDIVFHLVVAERYADRERHNLKVGVEFPTTPDDDDVIRQTLREAAWRLYGMTGGTHIIRSFVYDVPGVCRDVDICWRNRPTGACNANSGLHYPGLTQSSIHICSTPGQNVALHAAILAHEFAHAYVGLDDEYWRSNDLAKICGDNGRLIARCTHSTMSFIWSSRVNSLCQDRTHGAAPALHIQRPSDRANVWEPFRGNIAGPNTISECNAGDTNIAGPPQNAFNQAIPSAWAQIAAGPRMTGANQPVVGSITKVPVPHPSWSPLNFDFKVFADDVSGTEEVGYNRP